LLREGAHDECAGGVRELAELIEVFDDRVPGVGSLERRADEQRAFLRGGEVDQGANRGCLTEGEWWMVNGER
jgi:hypothetical protein